MKNSLRKLVLLPGIDGSVELLRGFVASLPQGVEAETLWYPTDRWMSYMELAGTLRGAIKVDEPFVLVAESYGTPLAVLIAALEPPNLKGVVLCGGFATTPLRGWRREVVWDLAPMLSHVSMPGFLVKHLLVGAQAPKALVETVTEAISWVTPKVMCARVRDVLNVDVRAELAQVKVPVLYVHPTQDRLVSTRCLEEMQAVKPARVALVGSPHMLLQAEPMLCAEVVAQFVAEL